MTINYISGTITNGYTLSSAYSGLTVSGSGAITGTAGALGTNGQTGGTGGVGLTVAFPATVSNAGQLRGGRGGAARRVADANPADPRLN